MYQMMTMMTNDDNDDKVANLALQNNNKKTSYS